VEINPEKIKEKVDYYLHFADIGTDEDQRNYEVSYEKFERLGFKTEISLDQGIEELLRLVEAIDITNPYSNV
jgi:nucleoside-diphosphate-sugar epimerase